MSVKGVAQVEREVITTYLTSRWTRSFLATVPGAPPVPDPGYGKDEICPVLYFGQPFDPSKPKDVAALSAYAVNELRGYGYYTLDIQDGTWSGQGLPLSLVTTAVTVVNPVPDPENTQWILETGAGSYVVFPQSKVEAGATVTFDVQAGAEPSFTASVAASQLHGVGFLTLNLAETQVEGLDVGTRGSQVAKLLVRVMIAASPPTAPKTAEIYAAAVAALFRGVMWVSDPSAPEGDLLRDMADSGVSLIRHYRRRDPIQERPNRISEQSGWAWFVLQFVLRRQYRVPVVGRQPVTPF